MQRLDYYRFISLLIVIWRVQTLAAGKHFSGYAQHSPDSRHCYSCMSEEFEKHWSYLEKVYYRPLNFTDHCHTMPKYVNIGTQECPHSLCVTVIEPKILAGQQIGSNVIRGCFSSVFRHGDLLSGNINSNNVLDTRCSNISAKKLLPSHMAKQSSNRMIDVCWCVGQLCNDYPSVNSASTTKTFFLLNQSSQSILSLSMFISLFAMTTTITTMVI